MKLLLKNVGKIHTASIEINGITVIAGENDTGKSTIGRALFAVFNSFYHLPQQIRLERLRSIEILLNRIYFNEDTLTMSLGDPFEVAKEIVDHPEEYRGTPEEVQKSFEKLIERCMNEEVPDFPKEFVRETLLRIQEVLNISDEAFVSKLLEKKLNAEFNNQVSNLFSEESGEIRLGIKDQEFSVSIAENEVLQTENPESVSLHTEVVYMDDPFVLDEQGIRWRSRKVGYVDHREHLRAKLFHESSEGTLADEILAEDKLKEIYKKLSSVCGGEIVHGKRLSGFGYRQKDSEKILNVKNLSTGLKTFVILKMLLLNGSIQRNGILVLDEPEIHLHPQWQLVFAELIVLIQKEFGIHVLMNTHSPYFLNAVEVYAEKYGIGEKCNYYLAVSEKETSRIEDVTGCTEKIYKKLAKPLQELENERGRL